GIRYLVGAALRGDPIAYESEAVETKPDTSYVLSMAGVFLMAMFIGGATPGLGGVTERESGVIRAISVSPMTLFGYIASKIVPSILLGLTGVTAASIIIGRADAIPWFMFLVLCGVFVSGIIIFLLISFADNQVAAIGVLKLMMPLFLVVGIASYFVPDRWIFFFYALPMYWQFEAIRAIILEKSPLREALMVIATGIPWFLVVLLVFMKRVRMKASAWNVCKKAA
ncbi:MAG: ABC transporter permease, partial [Clostridiales bacterium]|nr:ABC transporter permease [Clostridiales bacterium]